MTEPNREGTKELQHTEGWNNFLKKMEELFPEPIKLLRAEVSIEAEQNMVMVSLPSEAFMWKCLIELKKNKLLMDHLRLEKFCAKNVICCAFGKAPMEGVGKKPQHTEIWENWDGFLNKLEDHFPEAAKMLRAKAWIQVAESVIAVNLPADMAGTESLLDLTANRSLVNKLLTEFFGSDKMLYYVFHEKPVEEVDESIAPKISTVKEKIMTESNHEETKELQNTENRKSSEKQLWVKEDHLCRNCGGRILRCVKGTGMSTGGNPLLQCANCGASAHAISPNVLCWCGYQHWNQTITAFRCLPFSVLADRPELKEEFLKCGCDPGRAEIGIICCR